MCKYNRILYQYSSENLKGYIDLADMNPHLKYSCIRHNHEGIFSRSFYLQILFYMCKYSQTICQYSSENLKGGIDCSDRSLHHQYSFFLHNLVDNGIYSQIVRHCSYCHYMGLDNSRHYLQCIHSCIPGFYWNCIDFHTFQLSL